MQEYSTNKAFNNSQKKVAGRCCYKKYGDKCSQRVYGAVNGQRYCRQHYDSIVKRDKKLKSY